MSLTREQWIEMWEQAKAIEEEAVRLRDSSHGMVGRKEIANEILWNIDKIKYEIQSVIGQME